MSIDNIKVGDYARSYNGYIAWCKRVCSYNNFIYFDRDIIDTNFGPTNYFDKEDIKKYIKVVSPNIIDLIEEGDYVNGLYVHGITDYGLEVYMFGDTKEYLKEDEIKSIVTKEQFKSMEYKIEN